MSDADIGWRPIPPRGWGSPTTPSRPALQNTTATLPVPALSPSPSPASTSARKRASSKRGATSRFGIHGLQSISNLRSGLSHARKSSVTSSKGHGGGENLLLSRNERRPATRSPSLDSSGDGRTPLLQRSHNVQTSHQGDHDTKTTASSAPWLAVRPASIRIPFLDDAEVGQACSPTSEHAEETYQLADTSGLVSGENHTRLSMRTTAVGGQDRGGSPVQGTIPPGLNNTSVDVGTKGSVDLGRKSNEGPSWPLNSTPVRMGKMAEGSGGNADEVTAARSPMRKHSTEVYAKPREGRATTTDSLRPPSHEYEPTLVSLINMQAQVAKLQAANAALLSLNAAHEKTIAIHENTIACHAETIDSQEATIFRHEMTISDLNRELRFSDAERESLIENFGAEMANLNGENATLREDKWYLMGRVEELEQIVARAGSEPSLGDEASAGPRVTLEGEALPESTHRDDKRQAVMKSSILDNASAASLRSSSPAIEGQGTSSGDMDSPITSPSSMFSPRPCSGNSIQGVYAATPTPSIGHVSDTKLISTPDGRITRPSSRGQARVSSVWTGASKVEDGGARLSDELTGSKRGGAASIAPRSTSPARERTSLEQDLATAQDKLAAAEEHNNNLQAKIALQEALIRKLSTSAAAVSTLRPSPLAIPELPVLTYTKPCSVWLDRVRTSFRYHGLIDFIQRDMPAPVSPGSTAAEITCWRSQRLRAVVLLKHAVDDDILEDVLYLCGKDGLQACSTTGSDSSQSSLLTEDPYRLLSTISTLRRALPTSSSDLAWLDRIGSADYEGLDGFASLVLCIDKRQNAMYGVSADHYDVLLPKIQESIASRFPDFKKTALALDSSDVLPKKRWQLSVWLAKIVKK